MDRSKTDLEYNLKMNSPSYQNKSILAKVLEEEKELNQNSIEIKEELQGDAIEKYIFKERQTKTGLCKTCGCSIKSKILSCSICHISRCKLCVEKESNSKPSQKKGVKKLFYICKSCLTEQEGKMRKHDMTIHYEKEPTEFLQKKYKIRETDKYDNDISKEDSFENERAKKRKSSSMTLKKKRSKNFPEKIYNLIEKKSINYFDDNKEEMCIECNNSYSNSDKVKPFASIEQLLYYLQYYYEDIQLYNNEEYNSNKIDYTSIISNAIIKEKCQDSFITEFHFILCQNCFESLGKCDSLEFTTSLDKLVKKVHLLNQKKVLEDNIFSAPGIYSKLSIIITQFLILRGFSVYQKQFIQFLFAKIKAINEKIAQNEYDNNSLLKLILCSNSVNSHNFEALKDNHLKSKESIKELNELFSKFLDGSKEIFTSVSSKNNDLDQIIKILNNCFTILGQSNDGLSTKDTNNLSLSKNLIESLIKKFKTIVSNKLDNCEAGEQQGSFPFDNDCKSANTKVKDDNFTLESWPFSMKINELDAFMFNGIQHPNIPNNELELLLQSYNKIYKASDINDNNNINPNTNYNYFDIPNKSGLNTNNIEINNERPQIENPKVCFNNLPNFTLSLNNYNNTNTSNYTNYNQPLPHLIPNINQQNQLYSPQSFNQLQQLQLQQQINQLQNINQYQGYFPLNPFQSNQN